MGKEKCKTLEKLFQDFFKRQPTSIDEDEFGCTATAEIKHKNAKIVLEISELDEKEFETSTQPIEFYELKLKNGTPHYIISFYLQDDVIGKCAIRIYIEL